MDDSKVTKATLGCNEEHKAESPDQKKKGVAVIQGSGGGSRRKCFYTNFRNLSMDPCHQSKGKAADIWDPSPGDGAGKKGRSPEISNNKSVSSGFSEEPHLRNRVIQEHI